MQSKSVSDDDVRKRLIEKPRFDYFYRLKIYDRPFFTARCTVVHSALFEIACRPSVRPSVCPSVCYVGGSGSHRLEIL